MAFMLVFLLSFGVIIVSFNLVLHNYIDSDAVSKMQDAIDILNAIANKSPESPSLTPEEIYYSDEDYIVRNIVQPFAIKSEVSIALLSDKFSVRYPDFSDSLRERSVVLDIVEEINKDSSTFDKKSLTVLKTKTDSTYYVYLIDHILYNNKSPETPTHHFIVLYFDATPFLSFAERVNTILIILLLLALLLTLVTSLVVASSITDSIRKLMEFASKIGSGVYKRQNYSFFDKEFTELADDMNSMAEKIEKSDQDQKTFFQNASHELRTPLMSIQGYAEGIKYNVFDHDENAADIIISESQRLTHMVENLLSISRIDSANVGGKQIPKSVLDLRDLLESVTENIRGSALVMHKELKVNFPDAPVYLLGNENDLTRAFENLLSNGFRYASSTVHVDVSLSIKNEAVIQIYDDGEGISEDLLPMIFDRFTKGDGGKHGIGLALVKAIIKDHNGTVSAKNRQEDKGAIFTVTLPTTKGISE
jgi:signal transduction histidine kinase